MKDMTLVAGILACLLVAAPTVWAGSAENPEIEDPSGDAIHFEFQIQEPSLDVTKVWFTWAQETLQVHLLVEDVQTFGPDGTQDPNDAGTAYDVYWTMDNETYVARLSTCNPMPGMGCWVPSTGDPVALAGQAMKIERQAVWGPDAEIHGELTPQDGGVNETGSPAHIRIDVDPQAVGNPGPGSVLEAPAFSTYVDHHNPGSGQADGAAGHHPGHVDANDEAGEDFVIPASTGANGSQSQASGSDGEASGDAQTIPVGLPTLPLGLAVAALYVQRRDR